MRCQRYWEEQGTCANIKLMCIVIHYVTRIKRIVTTFVTHMLLRIFTLADLTFKLLIITLARRWKMFALNVFFQLFVHVIALWSFIFSKSFILANLMYCYSDTYCASCICTNFNVLLKVQVIFVNEGLWLYLNDKNILARTCEILFERKREKKRWMWKGTICFLIK